MVHSMTAFARVERAGALGTLSWEIRSVNHRYLEPHLRLPEALRDLEGGVRDALRQGLSRGKVECILRLAEESLGKPLLVTWLQVGALMVKIPLSIWLVAGGAGLEPMGVVGCAWATLVVNYLLLALAVVMLRTQTLYKPFRIWQGMERSVARSEQGKGPGMG